MNINLHIERLVLDGLPVTAQQGSLLQAAVEKELARLLVASPSAALFRDGASLAAIRGGVLHVAPHAAPAAWGAQIAEALYQGFGEGA